MSTDTVQRINEALEGRYRIESELGEGGMAVVYLADDLRHERKVALKVLKPELAAVVGGDRFLTEIKTTANLQHPHILPLFDSGEADSFLFYVMPYIEGETLRDKIDREKQLPVDEALGIATAVASALHTAHEAGIVHRDIKPGNILLSRGEPLVADFGIALAVGAAGGNRLTETGLSVGTPYYMSPEQATGDQVVGAASDTFALACVLYEMLVGEPPYPGTTAQAVLGKIIQGAPVSATGIRKSIPLNVDAAIRKALEKIPADRFSTAQDFARALADPSFRHGADERDAIGASGTRWRNAAIAASLVALVFAGISSASMLRSDPPAPVERFSLLPVDGQLTSYEFDISDDGTSIVYTVVDGGVPHLQIRRLGSIDPVQIPSTDQGTNPIIGPSGTEVSFIQNGQLKVAPLAGGVVRTLTDSAFCCNRWHDDGYLYYSDNDRNIRRVSATGGESELILAQAADGTDGPLGDFEIHPDGDVALLTVWGGPARIDAVDLESGERTTVSAGVKPYFTDEGHLVFGALTGQLLAARFDAKAMALAGPAVPLVEGVRVDGDNWPFYSMARNGDLAYWTGASTSGSDGRVVRVSRSGQTTPIDPDWFYNPNPPESSVALSPDGRRLAVKVNGPEGDDIWVKELPDGPLSRVTFDPAEDWRPRWSADGEWLYFISYRGPEDEDTPDLDLFRRRWDGTSPPELVLDFDGHIAEAILDREGTGWILRQGGSSNASAGGLRDLVGMAVGDTLTYPLAAEPYDEKAAALSPDGRWLAYESTETGRDEIYIRPYPNVNDGKWQVSTQGAINPRWARSGNEIFYISQGRDMTVATLDFDNGFQVVDRQALFNVNERGLDARANYAGWDVDLDDQHFLMVQFGAGADAQFVNEFILVQNWLREVEERLPR
ncbi:MAG: serine/threonine-protein kinase [Gemmatimonadetes bacterium]|nr:serine/threonine-protein kinase [Gemmatimonadota bacterium]